MALTVEERRARWREKARARYANLSPEAKADKLAKAREASKRRYQADLDLSRAEARIKARRQYAELTPEEREARRLRDRERYLQRRDDPDFRANRAAWVRTTPQKRTEQDVDRDRRARPHRNARIRAAQALSRQNSTRRYQAWTAAEDAAVMDPNGTVVEIALSIGRTRAAVVSRRQKLRKLARG